jgi:nucleotide-binding universal stress UspA family protein
MELLLVAAKKEVVHDYAAVVREAGLNPVVVDVAAFSAQNAYEVNYALSAEETIVLINVGAAISNINICRGGSSLFTRDVTIGGLLESGEDACLIVVGNRGHGGFDGTLLGSTSQALAHHAPCPLVVIRPAELS